MQCDWILCRIALGFQVAANSDHCHTVTISVFGGQTQELHELLSSITDLIPVVDSAMRNKLAFCAMRDVLHLLWKLPC